MNFISKIITHLKNGNLISAGETALAADFISTSAGAGDSGKVPKLASDGKIDGSFFRTPTVVVFTPNANSGGSTTQFDITNTGGTTYRYTWDGTGTDPNITALTFPTGKPVDIQCAYFNAKNKGFFTITGSGNNYFEITNVAGVVESNKAIGTGYLNLGTTWTKDAGLKYITVELVGAGSGGNSSYAGGNTHFGSHLSATGGSSSGSSRPGGVGTGGDINIDGLMSEDGYRYTGSHSSPRDAANLPSVLGYLGSGGGIDQDGSSDHPYTGCSGGYSRKTIAAASLGATEVLVVGKGGVAGTYGRNGGDGVIIVTEYY
jgi:hypothetical protein